MPMPYDNAQNPAHSWITQYQHVTGTVGLYTHKDGNYSFIEVREDSVYAAGITFTPTGIKLLEDYKSKWGSGSIKPEAVGDINKQLIEETYLMSQALYHSSWIKIADFADPVEGSAHMYGWHFNWDGSKAAVVTHVTEQYPWQQVYRLYVVSINEDDTGILSASIDFQEESIAEINGGELRVWNPENVGGGMQVNPIIFCNQYPTDSQPDYGTTAFNVPLYCFYKPDGSLRVIRFFREVISTKTTAQAGVEADAVNCPDEGWQSNTPGTLTGNYVTQTETYRMGFDIDGTIVSAMQGGGYMRNRSHTRIKASGPDCDGGGGAWNDSNLSLWTKTDFLLDCSTEWDCALSGPKFMTERSHIEYTEELSSTGGPGIGDKLYKFALLICGRATDSVAVIAWQQTNHTLTTRREYVWGYDTVQQFSRAGDYTCGSALGPKEGIWMPTGDCTSGELYVASTMPGSNNDLEPKESEVIDSILFETNVYIANPYEVQHTVDISSSDYYSAGPYYPYLTPAICNNIPSANLWYDVGSFSGRSIRQESETSGAENDGSNCEIDVDLPGTTAFWLGAT